MASNNSGCGCCLVKLDPVLCVVTNTSDDLPYKAKQKPLVMSFLIFNGHSPNIVHFFLVKVFKFSSYLDR